MFVVAPKVLVWVKPKQLVKLGELLFSQDGSQEAFGVEVHVEAT